MKNAEDVFIASQIICGGVQFSYTGRNLLKHLENTVMQSFSKG